MSNRDTVATFEKFLGQQIDVSRYVEIKEHDSGVGKFYTVNLHVTNQQFHIGHPSSFDADEKPDAEFMKLMLELALATIVAEEAHRLGLKRG